VNEQLVNDLQASKAELVRRGWRQGGLVAHDGRVCALGAVGCALVQDYENYTYPCHRYLPFQKDPRASAVVQALASHLERRGIGGEDEVDRIFIKNDHPDTTLQDIYDLFDKALAEAGGLA
jgi:hypothetical protein